MKRHSPVNLVASSLLTAMLLLPHGIGMSQEGSNDILTFPLTPASESCVVDPVPLSKLESLVGTPEPDVPELNIESTQDLDDSSRQAVQETIVAVFACFNAGEPLRAYAIYTDDYLRRIAPPDQIESLATPIGIANDVKTVLVDIRDLRLLADGRVYAVVILEPALIPVQKMYGFVLTEVDGIWLVDDVLDELRFSLP